MATHTDTREYLDGHDWLAKSTYHPGNYRLALSERYNAKAWFTLTPADA